jgi:hypothetical protein
VVLRTSDSRSGRGDGPRVGRLPREPGLPVRTAPSRRAGDEPSLRLLDRARRRRSTRMRRDGVLHLRRVPDRPRRTHPHVLGRRPTGRRSGHERPPARRHRRRRDGRGQDGCCQHPGPPQRCLRGDQTTAPNRSRPFPTERATCRSTEPRSRPPEDVLREPFEIPPGALLRTMAVFDHSRFGGALVFVARRMTAPRSRSRWPSHRRRADGAPGSGQDSACKRAHVLGATFDGAALVALGTAQLPEVGD